ncbi:MAG: hypothetical protein CMK96_06350 [Pseudomonas sp.]|nr:hypothetical protein [Pseudomonas sp.]
MEFDSVKVAADRMSRREPVGEGYLYGSLAVEMQRRGLVDPETLRKSRSEAYFHRKNVYGAEKARQWEDEARARHARREREYTPPTPKAQQEQRA